MDLEALLDSVTGRADGRRRWHCPERDHTDEHPSVSVHVSADGVARWRCWSGGHGGTAIDVVVGARGVDVGEAMRWLAGHHTSLPVAEQRPVPPPVAQLGHPDPAVARYATQASKLLWTAAGRPQRDWLAARGLGPEVLRANAVGADPGRRLLARPKGLPGGWPAVVYPSMTPAGEIVYLQARYLDPPATRSKYDNPSARLAANPRLAWTRPVGAPCDGVLVVCEGTADALIAAQAGLPRSACWAPAIPTLASPTGSSPACAITPSLRDAEVAICFDSDSAGTAGSARLVELLAERNVAAHEAGRRTARPDHVGVGRASLDGRTAHPARHRGGPDDRVPQRRCRRRWRSEASRSAGSAERRPDGLR